MKLKTDMYFLRNIQYYNKKDRIQGSAIYGGRELVLAY